MAAVIHQHRDGLAGFIFDLQDDDILIYYTARGVIPAEANPGHSAKTDPQAGRLQAARCPRRGANELASEQVLKLSVWGSFNPQVRGKKPGRAGMGV